MSLRITMKTAMFARVVAAIVVVALAGPSAAAAACELACAVSHDHEGSPVSSEAPCHQHEGSAEGLGVKAPSPVTCHESRDLPTAIVEAALSALAAHAMMPSSIAHAPAVAPKPAPGTSQRNRQVDLRPTNRPLRV